MRQEVRRGTALRKRIIRQGAQEVSPADQSWLEVERLAQVEITSEDPAYPIESALLPGIGSGWRAARPGEQTIHLLFDEPRPRKPVESYSPPTNKFRKSR